MTSINKTPAGLHVELPNLITRFSLLSRSNLNSVRDHINALEAQMYFNEVVAIFDEHPDLLAVRIHNTDDPHDDGRHVSLITEDANPGADWTVIDQALEEGAELLNDFIRHQGLYDYIDEFVSIGILDREHLHQRLGGAYDAIQGEPGSWVRLIAEHQADQLDTQTASARGGGSKPRM